MSVGKKHKNNPNNATKNCTAEEAIDSKWLIGSPAYLTAFLKYKS